MKRMWRKTGRRWGSALVPFALTLGLFLFAVAPAYEGDRSTEQEQSKAGERTEKPGQVADERNAASGRVTAVSPEKRELYCTILGDSIAKGYSGDKEVQIECYGGIAVKKIASEHGQQYTIKNFARNGLASGGMNEKILTQKEVLASVGRSDIIFITLGSNDLLNECKSVVQDILKTDAEFKSADEALAVLEEAVKKNPLLVVKVIDALGSWDYRSFEEQWTEMMETIRGIRKEDAQIIVTDIYNPVVNMKLPVMMDQVVEDIIGNMNSIIYKHAAEYGYKVAKVSESAISEHVQKDGLHPDQTGQRMIAELVYEEYGKQ